jgi:hypothetical protein
MKNPLLTVIDKNNKPPRSVVLLLILLSSFFVQSTLDNRKNGHSLTKDPLWVGMKPGNEVVIAWNELAYTIANEHDQFLSFIGIRALTMVHLAMHDALNAIQPVYEQYVFKERAPAVNPLAASSQAAYKVLITIYPQKESVLEKEIRKWLATIPDGAEKAAGIQLGNKSAAAILELRKDDGHLSKGNYKPTGKPGSYQYTPGFDWVWIPDLNKIKPFGVTSPNQFRAAPPPALTSAAYTESFNEVKAFGVKSSSARSTDETNYAHWWAEFAEHGWNRIGRITAKQRSLSLWETARMFALINMDIFDIYITSFDSKYHYDTWRPITAIHAAERDNNPATRADTSWQPEMVTPPWPEYPSAHSAVAAGGAEIVSNVFGTANVNFSMESVTALPGAKVRAYDNLDSAAEDCATSRIMNGFHFRFATDAGKKQGREVAKYIYAHQLRPINLSVNK